MTITQHSLVASLSTTGWLAGFTLAAGISISALGSPVAEAAENPIVWKAVALHRNGESYKKWQWLNDTLQERTDGRLSLQVVTAEELGLSGTEFIRILGSGAVDVAEITTGYVAGDFPMIEAPELPGLTYDYAESQQLVDTWMDAVVAPNPQRMGGHVIGSFAWGPMYLFSRFSMTSLDDLEGKKIRVFASGQAKYLEELGAEPMSLPITEVYGALQRGLIDGLVTGTEHIKGMSLWELTEGMNDIGIAPSSGFIVVSNHSWNALPEDIQATIDGLKQELSDEGWRLGRKNAEIGIKVARENGMNLDNLTTPEAWQDELKNVAENVVLPWWADRAGPEAVSMFNDQLGRQVGVTLQ